MFNFALRSRVKKPIKVPLDAESVISASRKFQRLSGVHLYLRHAVRIVDRDIIKCITGQVELNGE